MLSTGGKTTRQSREDKDPSPAGSLHIPPRKPRPPHTYHTLPSALADAEGPHLTNEERGPRRGWGGNDTAPGPCPQRPTPTPSRYPSGPPPDGPPASPPAEPMTSLSPEKRLFPKEPRSFFSPKTYKNRTRHPPAPMFLLSSWESSGNSRSCSLR